MSAHKPLQQLTTTLLSRADLPGTVRVVPPEEGDVVTVAIQSPDGGALIGKKGRNLHALQYVLRLLARNVLENAPRFVVDVNDYREDRKEFLRELATTVAQRVVSDRVSVVLKPMNAYERRIVHVRLADRDDVRTESVGEGADRRVVVHPTEFGTELGALEV